MKLNNKDNKQQGFTIIEVVLVLAIAGLIFLIVFLALPQLQRSRRDTQRQNDTGRMVAAVDSWASRRNGDLGQLDLHGTPGDTGSFQQIVEEYLENDGATFNDPSTNDTYEITTSGSEPTANGDMQVERGTCNGPEITVDPNVGVAVAVWQESGEPYCQDSQ